MIWQGRHNQTADLYASSFLLVDAISKDFFSYTILLTTTATACYE
jgi:hypothetical protein